MPPNTSGATIRNLGPIAQAITSAQNSLYAVPKNNRDTAWPDPLRPVAPTSPGQQALGWTFSQGQNLTYTPRPDAGYSASDLKALALYPLARLCIDNVKDQICTTPWSIQLKPTAGESKNDRARRMKGDGNISSLTARWEYPNPDESFGEWARPLIEDMLVIDAPAILLRRKVGKGDTTGDIQEMRVVPGDSITRYIDVLGYTPQPPEPAYAQLWNGLPRTNLDTNQLIYKPRNIVRGNTVSSQLYGQSPTESLAPEIQIGINRLAAVGYFYTQGSVPDMIQVVPNNVQPNQIREAQEWQNSELAGNLAKKHGIRLFQGFTDDGSDQFIQTKAQLLADTFDDLLIHKIAFGYGTSPQRLQRMMNRATAESGQSAAEEEAIGPYVAWFANLINFIIQKKMGFPQYEISFDLSHEVDIVKQAQADQIKVSSGYTMNERREANGDARRPEPEADMIGVITTAAGWVPINNYELIAQAQESNRQAQADAPESRLQLVPRGNEPKPGKAAKRVGAMSYTMPKIDAGQSLPESHGAQYRIRHKLVSVFDKQRGAAVKAAEKFRAGKALKSVDKPTEEEITELVYQAAREYFAEIVATASDALTDVAEAGSAKGFADLSVTSSATIAEANTLAAQWAHTRAAEMVGMKWVDEELVENPNAEWAISETTRDLIRSDVQSALSKETWMPELIANIKESGAFSETRARMIANTEVTRAQTMGNYEAWKTTGLVKTVRWNVSADEPCDICEANAAAGEVEFGKNFPSGVPCPAAHPNCRCSLSISSLA